MRKFIKNGVYLIVDPAMEEKTMFAQLEKLAHCSLSAIQIWDNFTTRTPIDRLLKRIILLFKNSNTPILINNLWRYLNDYDLDGVHFDNIPKNLDHIISEIPKTFIKGLTLTNNIEDIKKAESLNFNYLSFCSVFPSKTSNSCELVEVETIKKCKEITQIPIFLSGGITPHNIEMLNDLSYEGIAVVSGIMKAKDPVKELNAYKLKLKKNELKNNKR